MIYKFIAVLLYFIGSFVTVTVVGSTFLDMLGWQQAWYTWASWTFLSIFFMLYIAARCGK